MPRFANQPLTTRRRATKTAAALFFPHLANQEIRRDDCLLQEDLSQACALQLTGIDVVGKAIGGPWVANNCWQTV